MSTVSLSLTTNTTQGSLQTVTSTGSNIKTKKKLKGGLTLVYDPDGELEDELSMEESRALLPRYQKLLLRATVIKA
jgi:hypothetical protein